MRIKKFAQQILKHEGFKRYFVNTSKETINGGILTIGLLPPFISLPFLISELFFLDFKNKSINKTFTLEFIYSFFFILFFFLYYFLYSKNIADTTFTQFISLNSIAFIIELLLLVIFLPFCRNKEILLYSISLGMLIKSVIAVFYSIFKFKTLKLYGDFCYEPLQKTQCNTNNISVDMIFFILVYCLQYKDKKRKIDEYLLLASFVAAYFLGGRTFYLITIPLAFYYLDYKTLSKVSFLILIMLFFDMFFNDNFLIDRFFSTFHGASLRIGLAESYFHSILEGTNVTFNKEYGLYFHNIFMDIHHTTNIWLVFYFTFILFFPILRVFSLAKKIDSNSLVYLLTLLAILCLQVPLEGLQFSLFIFIFIFQFSLLRTS